MNLEETRDRMIDTAIELALAESLKMQADANVALRSDDAETRAKGEAWAAEAARLAARAEELDNIRNNDRQTTTETY